MNAIRLFENFVFVFYYCGQNVLCYLHRNRLLWLIYAIHTISQIISFKKSLSELISISFQVFAGCYLKRFGMTGYDILYTTQTSSILAIQRTTANRDYFFSLAPCPALTIKPCAFFHGGERCNPFATVSPTLKRRMTLEPL